MADVEKEQEVVLLSSESEKESDDLFQVSNNDPESRQRSSESSERPKETPEQRAERKKRKRIIQLEKHLANMEKAIERYDKKVADLADERNSAYLVRTRMIDKYMKVYKQICRKAGCNFFTGRPVEKKIRLDGITRCPEVGEAVEKFMNSRKPLFIPDFQDIKKVVTEFNARAHPPPLSDSEIVPIAKELFYEVIQIMRYRRRQDLEIVCPVESVTGDPAENDEELRRKLEENDKQRKSEEEVIEKFMQAQEESREVAMEVEEDPESSAGESDDEDDSEDLMAEQGPDSDSDDAVIENQDFTRDQVEEEETDRSESEDYHPVPKKQCLLLLKIKEDQFHK